MKTKLDPETVLPNTRIIIVNEKKEMMTGIVIAKHRVNAKDAVGFIEICQKNGEQISLSSMICITIDMEMYRYSPEAMTVLLLEGCRDVTYQHVKRPRKDTRPSRLPGTQQDYSGVW